MGKGKVIIEIPKTEKIAGNDIDMKAQIPRRWDVTKERKIGFAMDVSDGRDKCTREVKVCLQNQNPTVRIHWDIVDIYTHI